LLWTNKKQNQESHREIGNNWEKVAQQYLVAQGLLLLANNFHCRLGEIDLIMQDGDVISFIEVKYRKNSHFGGAIYAVTASKQQKLTKTAKFFLQKQGLNEYNTTCRFDVVAIEGGKSSPEITWLKNAF